MLIQRVFSSIFASKRQALVIAGSNRNGFPTKKCWFAFLVLIIETVRQLPADELDPTVFILLKFVGIH